MSLEILQILIKRNVRSSREATLVYSLLLFNIGFLTSLSLWWALLVIPILLLVWIFSGLAASAAIQLGSLTLPSQVFDEMDDQNKMITEIYNFFVRIGDKFRKDSSNGSNSGDDLHAEQ